MDVEKSWVERTRVGNEAMKSLTVPLKTRGCSYAKRQKACRFCAFHGFVEKDPGELGPERLKAKLVAALSRYKLEEEGIGELRIYNGGSFFANAEVKPAEREAILAVVAQHRLRKLLVESRPEHIGISKIRDARRILDKIDLEVAIGLETADDILRARLGKGFVREEFERAAEVLATFGVTLGAYILIKPVPMSDDEAKTDALSTLGYLAELRGRLGTRISARLEPFTVYEGMEIEAGHMAPSLRTIFEIIRAAPESLDLFLGWSEAEVQVAAGKPGSLDTASPQLRGLIDTFNFTGNRRVFEALG